MAGYIGTAPVPHATQHREVFTSTAGQTVFTTAGYTPEFLDVYINGIKIQNVVDFAATDGSSIVLTAAASLSDVIEVTTFSSFDTANQDFSVGTTTVDILVVNGTVDGRDVAADGVIIDSLGTAATTASTDYATAAQGTLAASALQPADALDATKLTGALPAISGASLTGINTEPFKAVAVTGATPSLNVGTYNFFDNGTLTANTTVSFTNVPTNANWRYSGKIGAVTGTNWDISTGAFVEFIDTSAKETFPASVFFKPDGLTMYILGRTGDDVTQYTLSTAWVISTAVYLQEFSISAQDTAPSGFFFKPDGTKMYMVAGVNLSVYEYDLSTAWDVSSASYLQLLVVSGQDATPNDIFFKPDGTKMYLAGGYQGRVFEYNLSTAWDVTSASSLQSFVLSNQDTSNIALIFKPDGTKMYMLGDELDKVYEYNLSTAWDVTTLVYSQSLFVGTQTTSPRGLFISSDGTRLFVSDVNNPYLHSYRLGTPAAITLPAAVVGLQTSNSLGDRVTYEFFTLDGGTTVNLISEEKV